MASVGWKCIYRGCSGALSCHSLFYPFRGALSIWRARGPPPGQGRPLGSNKRKKRTKNEVHVMSHVRQGIMLQYVTSILTKKMVWKAVCLSLLCFVLYSSAVKKNSQWSFMLVWNRSEDRKLWYFSNKVKSTHNNVVDQDICGFLIIFSWPPPPSFSPLWTPLNFWFIMRRPSPTVEFSSHSLWF